MTKPIKSNPLPKSTFAPNPNEAAANPLKAPPTKINLLLSLLRKPDGATIDAMMAITGWQAHSVRGALSGSIKKGLGLNVTSEKAGGRRIYRVAPEQAA